MANPFTLLFILGISLSFSGSSASLHAASLDFSGWNILAGRMHDITIPAAFPVQKTGTVRETRRPAQGTFSGDPSAEDEPGLKVYPNPATDFIRIEWKKVNGMEIHAELYDLFGRRISRKKADNSSGHMEIDIRMLQRSAYLLKVFSMDGKFSRTFRVVKY